MDQAPPAKHCKYGHIALKETHLAHNSNNISKTAFVSDYKRADELDAEEDKRVPLTGLPMRRQHLGLGLIGQRTMRRNTRKEMTKLDMFACFQACCTASFAMFVYGWADRCMCGQFLASSGSRQKPSVEQFDTDYHEIDLVK